MGRQLSALDIAFLALETQRTPVNVAALQIFEPPPGYAGNFVRDMLSALAERPPGPPFNLKLKSGLLGIPQWVEDDHFDLGYHVRHSALPQPGDEAELLALVSRLHSRVMDRERPLWEFHVIEGLADGRFAIYMKMHHAAIDGMGGVALLEGCYSTSPDTPARAPWEGIAKAGSASPSRAPRTGLLPVVSSLVHGAGDQLRMAPDLARLLAGHGLKALGLKESQSPYLFSAPRSIFNGHIGGARRFAVKTVSLVEIKKLAERAEATVNDIVLAVCSGALRRYLLDHDALPEKTLVASIPVSIKQINRGSNKISYVAARLATDEADPLARLRAINQSTAQAKREMSEVMPAAATSFAVMAQGAVAVLNRLQLAGYLPPPANVIISNVPGPRQPLYFFGAKMTANYPLSVLVDGQALNITVVSYCDIVDFGLMACRDCVPDVERLAAHIAEAFDELSKATAASATTRAPHKKKNTRASRKKKKKTPPRKGSAAGAARASGATGD